MKLRYYMRGIGICMIVTTLLLGVANDNKETLTDEEIKARAMQLGMVEEKAVVLSDLKVEEEVEDTKEGVQESEVEMSEETEETEETLADTDEEHVDDTGETVTEKPEEADGQQSEEVQIEEVPTEELSEESAEPVEENTVTLVIKSGASSVSVSKDLAEAGLVSDAGEYDRYLCGNGYDKILRVGTYEIAVGSSEEEIAKIITGKR